MNIFRQLITLRDFEKRHFPMLKTIEDREIVIHIGRYEVENNPLSLKRLMLLGITPIATLHRRLSRLKKLGVVIQHRSEYDRRAIVLCLSKDVTKLFQRYAALLESIASGNAVGINLGVPVRRVLGNGGKRPAG